MKSYQTFLLAGAVALATAGCYHHSYTVGSGGNTNVDAKVSKWQSHWLFGIIGEENVDVKAACPSGNATIKDYHSFVNGLIGALIGFIWHPTTVEVYCDGGAAPAKVGSLTLTPEQMKRLAQRSEMKEWVRSVAPSKVPELESALQTAAGRSVVAGSRGTAGAL